MGKPYTCDTSGAQFTMSDDLKGHVRTHTEDKLINVTCAVPSLGRVVACRNIFGLALLGKNRIKVICVRPSLHRVANLRCIFGLTLGKHIINAIGGVPS